MREGGRDKEKKEVEREIEQKVGGRGWEKKHGMVVIFLLRNLDKSEYFFFQ